jgi:hypothetical protein
MKEKEVERRILEHKCLAHTKGASERVVFWSGFLQGMGKWGPEDKEALDIILLLLASDYGKRLNGLMEEK